MLVRTYHRKIYNLAYRFTRRRDRAEELTQDAFLKLYQNLNSYRAESGSLQNWVMRVSRNSIIDQYRHTRRDSDVAGSDALELADPVDTLLPSPDQALYEAERRDILIDAIHALPEDLREAVILRDLEEMTYHEIAALLEIPEGTVKSRINRGRTELARQIRRLRDELETGVAG